MEKQIRRQVIRYGLAAILLATILGALIYSFGIMPSGLRPSNPPIPSTHSSLLTTFTSTEALKDFLRTNAQIQGPWSLYSVADMRIINTPNTFAPGGVPMSTATEGKQHSITNVQVEGVDEADTVKVDDEGYVFTISNNRLYVIRAYPPENATVLGRPIDFTDMYPIGLFVSGDRLVVLGSQYAFPTYDASRYVQYYAPEANTFAKIYDIQDRSKPILIKELSLTGSYLNSRMIGNYLYFAVGKPAYIVDNDTIFLPQMTLNGKTTEISPTEIRYFNGTEECYQYMTLVAMNLQNTTESPVYLPVMLGGNSNNMYVSQNNMYVTFNNWYGGNTTIYRIHVQASNMTIEAKGTIPGQERNQFSMDEYNGYFRIQTSTWTDKSYTNVYVLDMNLTVAGRLEGLAPGENFHSARFMGDRCYLVTFYQTDPLFVIDLSNVTKPQVLGNLTIPGYSDYLHPYDETHIIGVGKNTTEATEEGFAWYQGIKISIFDVSNVTNPIQIASYEIGDRGSDTPVLYDHKAFLFDRSRNLLVIPVTVARINEGTYPKPVPSSTFGEPVWQGAYVFDISLYHNITLEGCITHVSEGTSIYEQAYHVKRSLYIENVLYTISDKMIKMNNLENLAQIGEIPLQ